MKISDHYLGYTEKTLIVVTNNEVAKIYAADDRDVEEIHVLEVSTEKPSSRSTGTANSGPPDVDEMKKHSRLELYKELSDLLLDLMKQDYKKIVLCVPEARKNELKDAMHADVMKAVEDVVPKNLASLDLDQIIRILQEKKTS